MQASPKASGGIDRGAGREAARRAGYEIVAGTPEQLSARIAAEIAGVKELVAKAGIKPEN